MATQVFLSFASQDRILCDATYEYLKDRNIICWRFLNENQVGDDWLSKVRASIVSSSAMVALVSPNYIESDVCCAEYEMAISHNIPIFPLRCRGLTLNDIPDRWRRLVFEELRAEYDVPSLEKLYKALITGVVSPLIPTARMKIYRSHKFSGSANPFCVVCDGVAIGELSDGDVFDTELPAGDHILKVKYNIDHGSSRGGSGYVEGLSQEVAFHFVATKTYIFDAGYVGGLEGFISGFWGPSKLYLRLR
jgi:TIR domain